MAQKDLHKYPYTYHQLFLRAHYEGGIEIKCEGHNRAHNIRNDLYAFRRALVKDAHELVTIARSLVLSIEKRDNGNWMLVIKPNITPNYKRIADALAEAGDQNAEQDTTTRKTS